MAAQIDLLSCPHCGARATSAYTHKGWKIECSQRWGVCTMNARTHYQATKEQAAEAWNRRVKTNEQ